MIHSTINWAGGSRATAVALREQAQSRTHAALALVQCSRDRAMQWQDYKLGFVGACTHTRAPMRAPGRTAQASWWPTVPGIAGAQSSAESAARSSKVERRPQALSCAEYGRAQSGTLHCARSAELWLRADASVERSADHRSALDPGAQSDSDVGSELNSRSRAALRSSSFPQWCSGTTAAWWPPTR